MNTYSYQLLINVEDIWAAYEREAGHNTPQPISRMFGYQPTHRMVLSYMGTINANTLTTAPEMIWERHNRDDRPDGQIAPSLSVGDVIVISTGTQEYPLSVQPLGMKKVEPPKYVEKKLTYLEIVALLNDRKGQS